MVPWSSPGRMAMTRTALFSMATCLLTATAVQAQNRSPYEIDLVIDSTVTLSALVATSVPRLLADEFVTPWCGLHCDPNSVNSFDRGIIGNDSELAGKLSDGGVAVAMVLPFALDALDVLISHPDDGWKGYARDAMVMAETLALTTSLVNLLKLTVRRPRPLAYDPQRTDAERTAAWAAVSFPSGHTATAFAMATVTNVTYLKRHPRSPLVVPIWVSTYLLAGATGYLRTEAGDHFWTDVMAGAALGVGMGLLIPTLHLRPMEVGSTTVHVSPTVGPGPFAGAIVAW